MYTPPRRRRGNKGVAGSSVRVRSTEAHLGSRLDFLRRHEEEVATALRQGPEQLAKVQESLLQRTADTRNLRLAWDHIASGDGQAPGVDGLRCEDLDSIETWELIRLLSRSLSEGRYHPHKDRIRQIPKASGGTRTITIPTVMDRVVQRAVVQILQPLLDPILGVSCLGYRPGSSRTRALALAEHLTREKQHWVWLTQDIRNAFDRVPQQRLLDVVFRQVTAQDTQDLIRKLVATRTGTGLRQGGNVSPLLLNVYLHHFLDRKWARRHPELPLLRWADDILILCPSTEVAHQANKDLGVLLRPTGMLLKHPPEKAVFDLRTGRGVHWLGYQINRKEDGLGVQIAESAWESLNESLRLAQEKVSSPLRANESILGWLEAVGPCYGGSDFRTVYRKIRSLAKNNGFEEIPSSRRCLESMASAHQRWGSERTRGG